MSKEAGIKHPSHVTSISLDSAMYDEYCVNCGATDQVTGGWSRLAEPCPKAPKEEPAGTEPSPVTSTVPKIDQDKLKAETESLERLLAAPDSELESDEWHQSMRNSLDRIRALTTQSSLAIKNFGKINADELRSQLEFLRLLLGQQKPESEDWHHSMRNSLEKVHALTVPITEQQKT